MNASMRRFDRLCSEGSSDFNLVASEFKHLLHERLGITISEHATFRNFTFRFAIFVLTLMSETSFAQSVKPERVDAVFSKITSELPGCAVGVTQNGRLEFGRAYGLASLRNGQHCGCHDRRFRQYRRSSNSRSARSCGWPHPFNREPSPRP